MTRKDKKWCKLRHKIIYAILAFIVRPVMRILYGFKPERHKLKKDQGYFILSNHQALLDPLFLATSFNKPIYFVATDNLFNQKVISPLLKYFLAPIPKRKAIIDTNCLKICLQIAKENGTVGLFVEGNRAYADFQFYIDPSIVKLIKKMSLPLILYNLKGGYGVDPRWGNKKRKGKFIGKVVRVLSVEEINELTNEELYKIVCNELKVIDSDLVNIYKSNKCAEYLERVLFICPKCGRKQTIYSNKNKIYCSNCHLEVEYTEQLTFKSIDESFKFNKLVDWYKYQLEYIKNYTLDEDTIFIDENIELYLSNTGKQRTFLTKGIVILTKENITINEVKINIKDIISTSPIGGFKLIISTTENNYILKGHPRFNPVKYSLIMNILDGPIKEKGGDKYYGFDIY